MNSKHEKPKAVFGQLWLVLIVIFGGALILSATKACSLVIRSRQVTLEKYAVSDARQIGLSLTEFAKKHGSFPGDSTAASFDGVMKTAYDFSGSSSNAAFRQLFASEITQSERMFYARISGVRKPDGVVTPGEALKKGEVAFSYISNLSSKDDPLTPIVLTPLIPGTTKFDPKPFNGKAIVLHIDNSVRTYDINKDGHVYDKGIDILSAKHPIWKGKAPDIRYPE
jgi:hypothetical protein